MASSPMSSAYAAPHTPIASSKRPRVANKSSVKGTVKALPIRADKKENSDGHSRSSKKDIPVPPTPSKQLFSPGLRTEHGTQQLHPHHESSANAHHSNSNGVYHHHHHYQHNNHHIPSTPTSDSSSRSLIYSHQSSNGYDDMDDIEEETNHAVTPVSAPPAAEVATATTEEEEEEDDMDEFNPYKFISALPPHSHVCIFDKICLPPLSSSLHVRGGHHHHHHSSLPTLALDLDETLVHCTVEPITKPDLIFPVTFNGTVYQVYVRKRPYLDYFLETVSKSFEVVVFTASQKVYADSLLDKIDPDRKLIKYRLFREACLLVQGNYLKDLHVLGRDPKKTLLVDNSPHAYSYQIDNGIPIESWFDDDGDTELLKLIGFLKSIQDVSDYRPVVREHFKTYQLIENAKNGIPVVLTAPPF